MDTRLILHTFLALLLLLIPAGALYLLERKKLPRFGFVVARMVVQLLVLCLLVWVLIKVDSVGYQCFGSWRWPLEARGWC